MMSKILQFLKIWALIVAGIISLFAIVTVSISVIAWTLPVINPLNWFMLRLFVVVGFILASLISVLVWC